MNLIKSKTLFLILAALLVQGCSTSSPIQKYSESKSAFKDKPAILSEGLPKGTLYRIYERASTGFTSIQKVRETAEKRATGFCERQGKALQVVSEQTSKPPYILGNFPRIEIVFACVDKAQNAPAFEDVKYERLTHLKKLLDDGAITKAEFEGEKNKILSQ